MFHLTITPARPLTVWSILLALGSIALAQEAAPLATAKVISVLPYKITKPGLYVMQKDLVTKTGTVNAIEILSTDVIIDLGGHTLSSGGPADDTNTGIGIHSADIDTITIRNGAIRGFLDGIRLDNNGSTSGHLLVENIHAYNCGEVAIICTGDVVHIRRCRIHDIGFITNAVFPLINGIVGAGDTITIEDNVVVNIKKNAGNKAFGVVGQGSDSHLINNQVTYPTLSSGEVGVEVNGGFGLVVGNRVVNCATGILFNNATPGKYLNNLTMGCTTPFTGGTAVGDNN